MRLGATVGLVLVCACPAWAGATFVGPQQTTVGGRQVTITWGTLTQGTSQVGYGPSPVLGFSYPNTAGTLVQAGRRHSVTIRRPPPGTYFFKVRTDDGTGPVESVESSFTVPTAEGFPLGDYSFHGPAAAFTRLGGVLYVGGAFNKVGTTTGSGVGYSPLVGTPLLDFPEVAGTVLAVAPDGAGGLYIGGDFRSVGGQPRNNVAHLYPDLGVDELWAPAVVGVVQAIAASGTTVYLGGDLQSINGVQRRFAGAVQVAGGAVLPWDPRPDGVVRALGLDSGFVYLGGQFLNLNVTTGSVARAALGSVGETGTGVATTWNPVVAGQVHALAISGSQVYFVGNFLSVNVSPPSFRNHAAAVDKASAAASAWNPDLGGPASALALSPTTAYLGGDFVQVAGTLPRNHLAAFDLTVGGALVGWAPNANNPVRALVWSSGTVYAGGAFTSVGGTARDGAAAFDDASGADLGWNPGPGTDVLAIGRSQSHVYLGGNFRTGTGATPRSNAAAIDANGALTAWNPNVNGPVLALASVGSTVYLGGSFNSVGLDGRNNLAAVNTTTGSATLWNPNVSGPVRAIAPDVGVLYVGGAFASVGAMGTSNLARIDLSTGVAQTWAASAAGQVNALATDASASLYVGGQFTSLSGQPHNWLGAIDKASGAAQSFNPALDGEVLALAPAGNQLYLGGLFSSVNGTGRTFAAAVNTSTGALSSWNPAPNGRVNAIAITSGAVYLGGAFTAAGGATRNHAAAVDLNLGTPAQIWDPDLTFDVTALSLDCAATGLAVGGDFRAAGLAPRLGVAMLTNPPTCSGMVVGAPDAGVGLDGGLGLDAGAGLDAGIGSDAGLPLDGGFPVDAGSGIDAGPAADGGGTAPDAGRGDRRNHDAVLLLDGRVLVTGGQGLNAPFASPEIYTPWLGTWSGPLATRARPRLDSASALLPDGRVLVVGNGAFLYDPVTNWWDEITGGKGGGNAMQQSDRGGHTVTVLADGRVAVLGGLAPGNVVGLPQLLLHPAPDVWTWKSMPASALTSRKHHTATLMPDGTVLLLGGQDPIDPSVFSAPSIFDPDGATTALNVATPTNPNWLDRVNHSATRLLDGRVLVLGDESRFGASYVLLTVAGGTVTLAPGSFATAAAGLFAHTATLLPNGEVLVSDDANGQEYRLAATSTGLLTLGGRPIDRREGRATLLFDGTVLMTGGTTALGAFAPTARSDASDGGASATAATVTARNGAQARLLFDGRTLVVGGLGEQATWAVVGPDGGVTGFDTPMLARAAHTATLMPSGDVLVVGGGQTLYTEPVDECWLLHPDRGARRCAALPAARLAHTATLLENGQVLVAGGFGSNSAARTDAVLFSGPDTQFPTGRWTPAGTLTTPRFDHAARLLPDGRVWLAGGEPGAAFTSSEFYDPRDGGVSPGPALPSERSHLTVTLLRGDQLLLTGGHDALNAPLATALVASPSGPSFVFRAVKTAMALGREDHLAVALPGGEVVIAGGSPLRSAAQLDVFDPGDGDFLRPRLDVAARQFPALVLGAGGEALALGGTTAPAPVARWRRFEPAAGTPAHALTAPVLLATPGQPFHFDLTGGWKQATEASSGGDRNSSTATPRIVFMREDNEEVVVPDRLGFDAVSGGFEVTIPSSLKGGVWRAWAYINANPGGAATFVVGPRPGTVPPIYPGTAFDLQLAAAPTALGGQPFGAKLRVSTPGGVPGSELSLRFTGDLQAIEVSQQGAVLPFDGAAWHLTGSPSPTSTFDLVVSVRATGEGTRSLTVVLDAKSPEAATVSQDIEVGLPLSIGGCGCRSATPIGLAWALTILVFALRRRPQARPGR